MASTSKNILIGKEKVSYESLINRTTTITSRYFTFRHGEFILSDPRDKSLELSFNEGNTTFESIHNKFQTSSAFKYSIRLTYLTVLYALLLFLMICVLIGLQTLPVLARNETVLHIANTIVSYIPSTSIVFTALGVFFLWIFVFSYFTERYWQKFRSEINSEYFEKKGFQIKLAGFKPNIWRRNNSALSYELTYTTRPQTSWKIVRSSLFLLTLQYVSLALGIINVIEFSNTGANISAFFLAAWMLLAYLTSILFLYMTNYMSPSKANLIWLLHLDLVYFTIDAANEDGNSAKIIEYRRLVSIGMQTSPSILLTSLQIFTDTPLWSSMASLVLNLVVLSLHNVQVLTAWESGDVFSKLKNWKAKLKFLTLSLCLMIENSTVVIMMGYFLSASMAYDGVWWAMAAIWVIGILHLIFLKKHLKKLWEESVLKVMAYSATVCLAKWGLLRTMHPLNIDNKKPTIFFNSRLMHNCYELVYKIVLIGGFYWICKEYCNQELQNFISSKKIWGNLWVMEMVLISALISINIAFILRGVISRYKIKSEKESELKMIFS
jgi:hypothetical protein